MVGQISDETKIGFITLIDDRYNYVWNNTLGAVELRYPLNPEAKFEHGQVVKYVQTHDGRSIQVLHNLTQFRGPIPLPYTIMLAPPPVPGVKKLNWNWRAEVPIIFAPPESQEYKQIIANDEEKRVKAVAYNSDFKLLASYVAGIEYEVGVVYKAFITRIPKAHTDMGRKIGSLFAVMGKEFERVTDQEEINKRLKDCPWKHLLQMPEDDLGLPQSDEEVEDNGQERNLFDDEPMADNYAEQLLAATEGEEHLGLIVSCEPTYSIIWNPKHEFVRIPLEGQDPNNSPIWALAVWVKYRCLEEISQLRNGGRSNYTAYDIKKTKCEIDVKVHGNGVVANMNLKEPRTHSSHFFIAKDDFFGDVLCSAKDTAFAERIESPGAIVEVYGVFWDLYKHSKWIAFAYKNEDRWTKISQLPQPIETEVSTFFDNYRYPDYEPPYQDMFNESVGATRFKPPNGWRGIRQEEDRAEDVLGVVTNLEGEQKDISVIATMLGVARQPTKMLLGTWVRATIAVDHNPPTHGIRMDNRKSYTVLKSKKIAPPISTRVVNENGIDKLLICCSVQTGAFYENKYLGVVQDPLRLILPDRNGHIHSNYLVEICFSKDGSYNRYWKILKNHGEYISSVNTVALKLSFFPDDIGRTCDDAHTVLLDPDYDVEKHKAGQLNGIGQQSKKHAEQPTTSQQEASSSSTHFASTLAYQPKAPTVKNHFFDPTTTDTTSVHVNKSQQQTAQIRMPTENVVNNIIGGLQAQLPNYEPVDNKSERAVGIVVRKEANFAILYTKQSGICDAILLPKHAGSIFDQIKLGSFIGATFTPVKDFRQKGLTYAWMCSDPKKTSKDSPLPTRNVLDFVQLYITADFNQTKIKRCTEGLDPNETEKRFYLETEVGKVLLNEDAVNKNDLLGKSVQLWVTHIQKRYGCNWQIVMSEVNSLKGETKYVIEELRIVRDRIPPPITASNPIPNGAGHSGGSTRRVEYSASDDDDEEDEPEQQQRNGGTVKANHGGWSQDNQRALSLLRLGYADFLFGSQVADVMNGEPQRHRPRPEHDGENVEDGSENFYESTEDDDLEADEEMSESGLSNPVFSSDFQEEFGQRIRIIGGATPPPRNRYRFTPPPPLTPPRNSQRETSQQRQPIKSSWGGGIQSAFGRRHCQPAGWENGTVPQQQKSDDEISLLLDFDQPSCSKNGKENGQQDDKDLMSF